jgi:hypothetical protein
MPIRDQWVDGQSALENALELEIKVMNDIYKIHYKAEHECKDAHVRCDCPF